MSNDVIEKWQKFSERKSDVSCIVQPTTRSTLGVYGIAIHPLLARYVREVITLAVLAVLSPSAPMFNQTGSTIKFYPDVWKLPGPLLLFHTANDGKLDGACKRGYRGDHYRVL